MKHIELAFENLHKRYTKILKNYYPAHGSTGFTERNLTNNFVVSLELALGENSISWFEAPIDTESNKYIDAVVFDLDQKHSFMIESNRFSNPSQKIREAKGDIERMKNPSHYNLLEKGFKDLSNIKIEKRYAILLADVWKETKGKSELFYTWPNSVCDEGNALWAEKFGFENLPNYSLLIVAMEVPNSGV